MKQPRYTKLADQLSHGDVAVVDGVIMVLENPVTVNEHSVSIFAIEKYGSVTHKIVSKNLEFDIFENISMGGHFYADFADVLSDRAKIFRGVYSKNKPR